MKTFNHLYVGSDSETTGSGALDVKVEGVDCKEIGGTGT